ncbi:MAG: molybdopterin-dependent oxidoreductase [Daejeonella sp.]|uniref:molybdopterin-dependent oxidoreductase n=1 Tax=Daejeonella sp. TaxID=2805397 RepID=UPI003C727F55
MMNKPKKPGKPPLTVEQKILRRNFISFTVFTGLGAAAYGGWTWLRTSPLEAKGVTAGARKPFRRALNQSEVASRKVFSSNNLARTYPKSRAAKFVRQNGAVGLKGEFKVDEWQMALKKKSGEVINISIDQIRALPKTELIFDFKCVEGWDQIQHWGGVSFLDFIDHFELNAEADMHYVGMQTPDKKYYVGIDMESILHPQTILAYEMNDLPLKINHGAPLRLIIPVKYGIKNLKRIGTLILSEERPADYWAERGYDYYSGL